MTLRTRAEIHREEARFVAALFQQDEWLVRQQLVAALALERDEHDGVIVADVGSGPGCSLRALEGAGADCIVCVDLFKVMLTEARRQLDTPAPYPWHARACMVQAHGEAVPLATASVHAALCSGLLHAVHSPETLIYELARIVRPGGRVVIGNKGLAPWLAGSDWYAIAVACLGEPAMDPPPVHLLPPIAEDVRLEWVPARAFYILSFQVGSGPTLNLDAVVPGDERTVAELLHTEGTR